MSNGIGPQSFPPGQSGQGVPSPYFYELSEGQLMLMKTTPNGPAWVMNVDENLFQVPFSAQTGPGSMKIGQHALGSSGENFTAVNRTSNIAWFPTWQGVSRDGQTRYAPVKRILAPTTVEQPFGTADGTSTTPCEVEFTTSTTSAYFVVDVEFAPVHSSYSGRIYWRASRTDGDVPLISEFVREVDLSTGLSLSLTLDYPLYIESGTPLRLEISDDAGNVMQCIKATGGNLPNLTFVECLYQDVDINAFEAKDGSGNGTGRWFKPSARVEGGAVISGLLEVSGPDFN